MLQKLIVAFGHFDPDGGRSWAIRTGLASHDFPVQIQRTTVKGMLGKYRDLARQWRSMRIQPDVMYVPFLGHWILPLAWFVTRRPRIPLIFDAFVSLYETEVCDRRRIAYWHPKAWLLWWVDWLCCRLCDAVLLDTEENADYFVQKYAVPRKKILVLPVGCRTDLFQPDPQSAEHPHDFCVHFHGTYIPLQGIETILRAAAILQQRAPDVSFTIIGTGQTKPAMLALAEKEQLRNVTFIDSLPIESLPDHLTNADVCLGIFGTSAKASRVIPNKAYEALSAGKPLITAKTAATQRIFRDECDALLIPPGNPEALASAIIRLKDHPQLRITIAKNGQRVSKEHFQPEMIVRPLVAWLKTI